MLKTQLTETRTQLDTAREGLAAADAAVERARTLALQNRQEARRSAEQLEGAIDAQHAAVGLLGGSVDAVKGDVAANRQELDRALADLGQQNSLIARNRDELDALKRSGSRDVFEFDLRKSKTFTRVGPLAVRLNKTDDKHQRYTVTLVVNDRQVEKQDNGLLEPVQFYLPGTRGATELVAQEVRDGRIVGYVSGPKEITPRF
jgi:chromosome segregation ATPase